MKFSESLKKNRDFQSVYRKGKPYGNKYLVMYLLPNDFGRNRVGISVSKKVGNSIIRHHLTRLIRESYRLHEEQFQCGYDIVIIARTTAKDRILLPDHILHSFRSFSRLENICRPDRDSIYGLHAQKHAKQT